MVKPAGNTAHRRNSRVAAGDSASAAQATTSMTATWGERETEPAGGVTVVVTASRLRTMSDGLRINERAAASSMANGTSLRAWHSRSTMLASPWWTERPAARAWYSATASDRVQRLEPMDELLWMTHRNPAGRQHGRGGAAVQNNVDDRRGCGSDVLAVVEHQEAGRRSSGPCSDGVVGVAPCGEPEIPGHDLGHAARVRRWHRGRRSSGRPASRGPGGGRGWSSRLRPGP